MRFPFTIKTRTAYLFWMFRWMLLFLLFMVFGDFLEGPPTRVVVRSMPLILACNLLSFLTGQFLHQVHRLHLALVTIPALIIPAGYIHFAQAYYNGSKNELYHQHITFFFTLMCLIGLVYFYSLFVIQPKKTRAGCGEAEPESNLGYEITLYNLDSEGQRGSVKLQEQGEEDLPEYIAVDGFSKDIAIDLNEYWDAMLDDDVDDYSTNVTTYETIVKFGEPMQLVDNYQLVLKLT